MKKQLAGVLGAIILGIASGNASAADVDTPAAAYDWSGPYIGLQAAYGFGETEMYNTSDTSGEFDYDGGLFGAAVGWNHQAGSFVFGVEGDLAWSNIEGSSTPDPCDLGGCNIDLNWLGTARLRAGYAFDNALIFAAGGLAAGEVEVDINDGFSGGTETLVGWTIGAGAEFALSEALTAKLEYLYVDLGDMQTESAIITDASATHIIRAGVNWHF